MTTEHGENAKSGYYQLTLSGFQGALQPANKDSEGDKREPKTTEPKTAFWQKSEYIVFIPFIVKQVSISDSELRYKLQVDCNIDILIAPRPKRGQVDVEQIAYIPHTETKRPTALPLVSRISTIGMSTFSFADGLSIYEGIAHVFSGTMDKVNAALQCIILKSEKTKARIVDSGKRVESTPTPKGIRANKKKGRSAPLRAQVLPENEAEATPTLAETNGEILGNRHENWETVQF
jgi:hypothetical protein